MLVRRYFITYLCDDYLEAIKVEWDKERANEGGEEQTIKVFELVLYAWSPLDNGIYYSLLDLCDTLC